MIESIRARVLRVYLPVCVSTHFALNLFGHLVWCEFVNHLTPGTALKQFALVLNTLYLKILPSSMIGIPVWHILRSLLSLVMGMRPRL
jgi:hypothetical protein